jgi:hypothetical protein
MEEVGTCGSDAGDACGGDCRLTARLRFSPWASSAWATSTSIGPCADWPSRAPAGDGVEGEKSGGRASAEAAPGLAVDIPRVGARGLPKALERTGLCSAMERRKERSSRVGNLFERQQSMQVRAACARGRHCLSCARPKGLHGLAFGSIRCLLRESRDNAACSVLFDHTSGGPIKRDVMHVSSETVKIFLKLQHRCVFCGPYRFFVLMGCLERFSRVWEGPDQSSSRRQFRHGLFQCFVCQWVRQLFLLL